MAQARRTPRALAATLASAAVCALALAASASATVYCVAEPACPAGGQIEGATGAALQSALEHAQLHVNAGGPDEVLIGPGSYSRAGGFEYVGEAVVIRGAGAATTLTASALKGGKVMLLDATEAAEPTLSAVSVAVPAGEDMYGLWLQAGRAEGISIQSPAAASVATGLRIEGGTFSHGSIAASNGTGIDDRGGEVLYSTISGGGWGVQASSHATLRGDTISGGTPVVSYFSKPLIAEDDLIEMGGANTGLDIVANINGSTNAVLRHLAIVGGGRNGVLLAAEKEGATATLEDSIVAEAEHPLVVFGEGSATAALTTRYSSYEAAQDSVSAGGTISPEDPLLATPDFVSPLTGDWRLAPGSPLIDTGTPGALGAGEFPTDLAGNPRIVGGRRDVGPYEYQWRGPAVVASADRSTVEIGTPVSFSGTATAPEPGDSVTSYQWSFDDGASVPAGPGAVHAFSKPGPHTVTLTATDLAGLSSSVEVHVTATVLPECLSEACGGGCVLGGTCRRGIAGLAVRPRLFHAAHSGGSTGGRHGAKVSYAVRGSVSMVDFTIRRVLRGVVSGTSCRKPARGITGPPCSRYGATVGAFSRISPAGGNGFRLTGRARGKTLAPGRYVLIAHLASAPHGAGASAEFQIVR